MYKYLENTTRRPELFQEYTAKELWVDEHISKQMLQFHLDGENDIASRSSSKIDKIITFIVEKLKITKNTDIIDYGCGPGLYTQRLAKIGARVSGIDFSPNSIEYAEKEGIRNGLNINYIVADYLNYQSQDKFDLALLIYYDLCALAPIQRKKLLTNIYNSLKDDGRLVLDVLSLSSFKICPTVIILICYF